MSLTMPLVVWRVGCEWPRPRPPGARPLSKLSLTGWLSLFVGTQVLILAYYLGYFGSVQQLVKMEQEVHPPETAYRFHMPLQSLVNSANLLTGAEYLGLDATTGDKRRNLSFARGQMIWFVLERTFKGQEPVMRQAAKTFTPLDWNQRLKPGWQDGYLNFLYDVGERESESLANWSSTAVGELQGSSLLPWAKHLDFVVLSSLNEQSAGGLKFITNLNPAMAILAPPHDKAKLMSLGGLSRTPNVLVFEPGIHKLTEGLWVMVLPVPQTSGEIVPKPSYELDLVVKRSTGGLAVFSGSALNPPSVAIDAVQAKLGKVAEYVGDTGWEVGFNTEGFEEEVVAFDNRYPKLVLVPNGRTSMVAHGVLEGMLGTRYIPGRLGTRVQL